MSAVDSDPSPGNDGAGFFAPVRGRLFAIITLSALGAATGLVPFIAIVELARLLLPSLEGAPTDAARVWTVVGIAASALLLGFAATFASGLAGHLADAELQSTLRHRIIRHLERLPLGWFDTRSSGSVRKLVENDVSALHQIVAHTIQDLVTVATVTVLSLAYLIAVQWQLALAAMVPLVVAVVLYVAMVRTGTDNFAKYDEASARLADSTVEFVHGIAVVKRFGQVGRSHRRYREETRAYVNFVGKWTKDTATLQSIAEIATSPVVVLLFLLSVGSALVWGGAAQPVDVLPGVLLGLGLTGPLMKLGASAQFLRNAAKAQESLAAFLETPVVVEADTPREPSGSDVSVQEASFSYDGTRLVLENIVASCTPGTVTALVGPSGSGKSTLAKLVPRFYDATAGRVCVGGIDVRDLASSALYGEVGFVFQDVQLLRTTLRDNIRLTVPGATDAQVAAAARAAQIHDRILRFPRGYDSVVGEDANLSGGEAQRVTIARAILTDAPILVLDEATAFADPDSEAAIQGALSALTVDRTVIVVAHRLHTIVGADQILVLEAGRLVERGTHAELIETGGAYARMWADYRETEASSLPPLSLPSQSLQEGVTA